MLNFNRSYYFLTLTCLLLSNCINYFQTIFQLRGQRGFNIWSTRQRKLKCVKWISKMNSDREQYCIYKDNLLNSHSDIVKCLQFMGSNIVFQILSLFYHLLTFLTKPKLLDEAVELKTVHRKSLYLKYLEIDGRQWHVTCEWWTTNGSHSCLCEHFNILTF